MPDKRSTQTKNDPKDPVGGAPTADARALVGVIHTAALLRGRMAGFFREYGLTMAQYNVLRILRGAGPDGLPSQEIARRVIERVPDMTRLVNRLEEAGLVTRGVDPDDGRVRTVAISAKGRRTLTPIEAPLAAFESELFSELSRTDHDQLFDILSRIRNAARDD